MSLLRFDNVTKAYPGSAPALSEVSFSVEEGEMLFVTGHSGAGKSTLLRIIAGKEKSYNGQVVFSPGYSVGMLDQEPQLDDNKTVRQVVRKACRRLSTS